MARDAVSVAPTAHLVTSEGICGATALWTGVGCAVLQPVAQAALELTVMETKAEVGRGDNVVATLSAPSHDGVV